ncbi:hypothetical protein HDV01_000342 [Terramyces sp. JEL0728]|nr:hypothetical protein HDV01_000342 [Terramyces sp. JEL0728]
MFGAFRQTLAALSGLIKKRRFRLTSTQKYRHRKRLQGVDSLVQLIADSGVQLKALDKLRLAPKESEMSAFEKYWVPSKRFRDGFKPVHWVPKWTKTAHPRGWKESAVHEFKAPAGKSTEWDQ